MQYIKQILQNSSSVIYNVSTNQHDTEKDRGREEVRIKETERDINRDDESAWKWANF